MIRERACYAIDRSLKRALVSSPLALIQPFFLFKSDGLGEHNQTKLVKTLVDKKNLQHANQFFPNANFEIYPL